MAMIDAAEEEGLIKPGRSVVVEPTSGNTGIALAMVCAARGYELILTLPEGMSRERAKLLRAYGAEVRETPSLGGMNEAVALAEEIREQRKGFMPHAVLQPRQPRGPPAHHRGGDLARHRRRGRRLRRRRRHRRHDHRRRADAARTQPRRRWSSRSSRPTSPVLSGGAPGPHKIQGIGAGFVPEVLDRSVIDEIDRGRRRGRAGDGAPGRPARRASWPGSRPGPTSRRRCEVAARPEMAGKRVVTIVCDSGERYMSLPFFSP